jgi:hypothetical protein
VSATNTLPVNQNHNPMMLERDLKRDRDEELGVSRQELGVTLDLIMKRDRDKAVDQFE